MFAHTAIAADEFVVKPVGFQIVWDTMSEEFDGFGAMNAMEIKSESGGHSRFSMLGSVTESHTFRLASKPKDFRVEMNVWSDMESITVPFSVKAGLGL